MTCWSRKAVYTGWARIGDNKGDLDWEGKLWKKGAQQVEEALLMLGGSFGDSLSLHVWNVFDLMTEAWGTGSSLGLSGSCLNHQFSSVAQSCPTLRPHESQHARPPCPSPTPRVHSDSRPSSQWCHPAISSSVVPFSSCPQSLPASQSFPMSQLHRTLEFLRSTCKIHFTNTQLDTQFPQCAVGLWEVVRGHLGVLHI